MNKAEILLGYMDQIKAFIELIHTYIEKGLELLQQVKVWISTMIDWIEKGVDYLVEHLGGRADNQIGDDYLFV